MSVYPEVAYGANYDKDLDVKEIAKRIRKTLKKDLPEFKFSVRISRYSGGQSINVTIKGVPDGFELFNPEFIEWEIENPHENHFHAPDCYTRKAQEVQDYADSLLNSYNFNGSNSMVDYFHVNFYGHVSWGDWNDMKKEAIAKYEDSKTVKQTALFDEDMFLPCA